MVDNVEVPVAEVAPVIAEVKKSIVDMLSGDLKNVDALKNIPDVDTLAKNYIHAQSLIGKRVVDLSPEDTQVVFNKMGRPEDVNGYELPEEGIDAAEVARFKELAFKAGISKNAAKDLFLNIVEDKKAIAKINEDAAAAKRAANKEALVKEFGDALEQRIELAKAAIDKFGGEAALAELERIGEADNPAIIKLLSEAGKKLEEGRVLPSLADAKFGVTPEEARNQAMMLMRHPAYFDKRHPEHRAISDKVAKLYKI